jgi:hypothetical protein
LFSTPACAHADSADELQARYDAVQHEMNANATQITSLQNKLDATPNKGSRSDSARADLQSTKNTILDLKQKNDDLFADGDAVATQLKKMGRDPDRPQPSRDSASKPADPKADASTNAASKPLQKQDIGDVASADVNSLPPEIIPLKPVPTINTQNVPPAPVASNNSESISPPIPPVHLDPAVEEAIDEKVRKQKPEVDALFAPPPVEPEPPPIVAVAPPVTPVEPPPQAEPATDWGPALVGGLLLGGVLGGIAASSDGGGGYSGMGHGGGGGGHGGGGGGGHGGAIHCH